MSPMSNRSGSSTPAQAAPIVPSMVPMTQKATAGQSSPMDVLEALRSRKASLAVDVARANGGVTIQGVKLLEAGLKAAEIREIQCRNDLEILKSQLKLYEALPAQLAALQDQIERQQQRAAKGPSPEDVETRLRALENTKPAVETTYFEELQLDVQSLKLETKKLNRIPEQLEPLQATVARQGQEIAEALSQNAELKTEVDNSLATIKEEVEKVQEQQKQPQAMMSKRVKEIARAELKPDIEKLEKLEGIQTQHQVTIDRLSTRVEGSQKAIEDVSTKTEANQRSVENMTMTLQAIQTTTDDLKTLNLPARLSNLQEKIGQIEQNDGMTNKKAEKLGKDCERFERMYSRFNELDEDFKDLDDEVKDDIGPIRDAFKDKNQTIIERMTRLETGAVNAKDFNEVREAITGVQEDKEKLANDLQTLRATIGAPPHQNQQTASSPSGTNDSGPSQRIEEPADKVKSLKENSQKFDVKQAKQAKTIDKIEKSQNALQTQQDATTDQIKILEEKQTKLANEYNTIVERLNIFENAQAKLSEGHGTITTGFETLKTTLSEEHNQIVDQVNQYREEQVSLGSRLKTFQTQRDSLSEEEQTKLKKTSESLESCVAALDKTVDGLTETQKEVKEIKETSESLLSRVAGTDKAVDKLSGQQTDLSNGQQDLRARITTLETASSSAPDQRQSVKEDHADTVAISSKMDGLETRLRSVENLVGGTDGLSTRFDQLQVDVEEVNGVIERLREGFISIFQTTFDPFKESVEKDLKAHDSSFAKISEMLDILRGKVEASQKECPAAAFSAPQLKLIQNMVQGATEVKQDLSRLQDFVRGETKQRIAAVEDLQQQVAIKQDAEAANKLMDTIKHSIRALTAQYENIVSDDLHQRMTHWFMQDYSQPTANLLRNVPNILHELQLVQSFTEVLTRIPNSVQTLSTLAQLEPQLMSLAEIGPQLKSLAAIVPQLTALAQSPPTPGGSHGASTKTAEPLKTLEGEVAKAVQQHSSLAQVVKGLQESLHSLNKAPFAKADSLSALERSIESLRAELKTNTEEEVQARKEFGTKAGKEHDQRLKAEETIKTSIKSVETLVRDLSKRMDGQVKEREAAERNLLSTSNEKVKELENAQKTASDQSEKIQKAIDQLRLDLDKALSAANSPDDKQLLGWLPLLFLHVGQLQWVLEDLNQNSPRGGLKIKWHVDWKEEFQPHSPFPDAGEAPATPKSKGKGKKQA
ncbi:hypothetical protein E8E11_010568 [Didymella keratinophila]|nr:hypothetical protein E8E11_010568 [Didymella keratinophila]